MSSVSALTARISGTADSSPSRRYSGYDDDSPAAMSARLSSAPAKSSVTTMPGKPHSRAVASASKSRSAAAYASKNSARRSSSMPMDSSSVPPLASDGTPAPRVALGVAARVELGRVLLLRRAHVGLESAHRRAERPFGIEALRASG